VSDTTASLPSAAVAGAPASLPVPPPIKDEPRPDSRKVGMIAFLLSEVAFFSTLIMTYLLFVGRSKDPTPAQALSLPLVIVNTILLLSSSVTIHLAEKALHRRTGAAFALWWGLTIALGVAFLGGTAYEWRELIYHHHLTISRNLFGTTYYTLVGFHAAHVTVGVIALLSVLGVALRGRLAPIGAELVAWYWHFVDAVWIVVFLVVYVIGR
jgi:cytochrome c oxidase subunit 3/cytochrome o ubiquinol oxidase subunit 3